MIRLKGCADIDEPLTLLSDVGAFKAWLRSEPTWGHAAETAEGILRSVLELPALRGLVERARQRWMCPEAYQTLRQVRRGWGGIFVAVGGEKVRRNNVGGGADVFWADLDAVGGGDSVVCTMTEGIYRYFIGRRW